MSRLIWEPVKYTGLFGLLALGMGGAFAAQAESETPLSAIDWLSDSIEAPAAIAEPVPVAPQTRETPVLTVAPLDSAVVDDVGTFDGTELGLEASIWAKNSASELAERLKNMPAIALPSLREFHVDLVSGTFAPPADAIVDESFFLARVDTLMGLARFDDALALLRDAGTEDPERFRRYFDIGLLTGTEGSACEIIRETPDVSPTFPARVFCLARNGEWDVAALTLGTAEALGILSNQEDQLLMRFLDPDLFEGEPVPPVDAMSPLLFRLYEAIGERPLTETLPVAFAVADLSETVGWKDRLRAAERLAGIGALPPGELIKTFKARSPAASGGIWTRVRAVQEFERAEKSDDAALSQKLPDAWDAAQEGGYATTLAPWFLSRILSADVERQALHTAFEVALYAGDSVSAAKWSSDSGDDKALLALATGGASSFAGGEPLATAVRQSLAGLPPSPNIRTELDSGRVGSVLLDAIAVLAEGADGDPRAVGDALAVLVALGLNDLARQVSVELLLDASQI